GSLLVKAPRGCPKTEIDRFVLSKRDWIEKQRRNMETLRARKQAAVPFTDGDFSRMGKALAERLPALLRDVSRRLCVTYGKVTVRPMRSRWGSCSSNGNLSFNSLLAEAPPSVQEYVVVHELCHRLEMNHSSRFWDRVRTLCPDYADSVRWLKTEGKALLIRIPED
ncbi:MAG: M48 family metallopeptidase, partial [Clostridia bacterium]|nr:M48 family metallopeptidase [Clostridia bacterium]